jgi:hypothetical protein
LDREFGRQRGNLIPLLVRSLVQRERRHWRLRLDEYEQRRGRRRLGERLCGNVWSGRCRTGQLLGWRDLPRNERRLWSHVVDQWHVDDVRRWRWRRLRL